MIIDWLVFSSYFHPELAKYEPKGQDQIAKTLEIMSKVTANCNKLNKGPQIINYNTWINIFLKT